MLFGALGLSEAPREATILSPELVGEILEVKYTKHASISDI